MAFVIALSSVACRRSPAAALPPSGSDKTHIDAGARHYELYCKLCHGADGAGYVADHANQLSNPLFLATAKKNFLWYAIERGRPGTPMAGFGKEVGGPLDEDAIEDLIAYLRSLSVVDVENAIVNGNSEVGKAVYGRQCASCHGVAGEGKTATSLNNPYFLATASNGYLAYTTRFGRPGTAMGGFAGRLTDEEIGSVVAYIRTWARNYTEGPINGESLPPPEEIVTNPSGPAPNFSKLREGKYVAAAALADAFKQRARMILLDARPLSDWYKSHIPGAYPAPYYNDAGPLLKILPRDGTWIVAYCACPHVASEKVMDQLRAAGVRNTAVLDEGILEWSRRGLPTTFGQAVGGDR
jgi:mono/diheme cytochrome c family protein/rhodanese-related sulfurtransferase